MPMQDEAINPRSTGMTSEVMPEVNKAGEEIPTEDEQLDYDLLVIRAQKMMYGPGRENILKLISSGETPAQGLGKAAATLVKSLVQSGKQAGREISGEVAINAGAEIVEDLSELAVSSGVVEYENDKEETSELQDAMLYGVKFYGDGMVANGEITPDMQDMAKKQMDEGIQEELAMAKTDEAPKKKPIAEGVEQAVNQPSGIVGGMMGGNA